MAIWLYPISERSGKWFELNGGSKLPTSIENYKELVRNKRLREDAWWRLRINYKRVQPGDEIYVYTGDQGMGIIGYAKVKAVEDRFVHMGFDFEKCESLIRSPIRAHEVHQWIHYPRSAVCDLEPFRAQLEHRLPWRSNLAVNKSKTVELKKLRLRPFQTITATSQVKRHQQQLIHDTLLKPIASALEANGFSVGMKNFGKLQIDLVGIRGKLAVIVEGKSNSRGRGREEARQAFGQLHEYQWYFSRTERKKMDYQLWVAFQNQPEEAVIEFLDDHGLLVSWYQNNRLSFSVRSKERFDRIRA